MFPNAEPRLYTPAEAAELLSVKESWLRGKAAARAIPCSLVGKHLRFSAADLAEIVEQSRRPVTASPLRTRKSA